MMEGVVGSRMSRASSRYGPSSTAAAAAAFNGPVRKWKRKWVHVSPPPPPAKNSQARSNGYNGNLLHLNNNNSSNNNNRHRLLLCRWTPLSPLPSASAAGGDDGDATPAEEPPKRKFRYTPVVVLEEQRKAEKKAEREAKTSGNSETLALQTSNHDDEFNNGGNSLKSETQDSNTSHLDLGLCLKGHDDSQDNVNQSKEGEANNAKSGGFWMIGTGHLASS
ncbi:hypothetical protein Tsubulata_043057 [Turnera subulata]|uniref:Uncharacterized protein n=1 Tax=Turnera subulata TaxID=218843 RepID=A0A9Q0JQS4_9ROSI|nr:hypothetical protein Tsubulata_043057 [Turnera subulata]